jgi:magnesium transporter
MKKIGPTPVQWTDIVKPTAKDLARLKKEFDLHPLIVEELKGPSARTRVEAQPDYLYFIYYFPIYDAAEGTSSRAEIDFIVSKDAVVTVHYEPFDAILAGFDPGERKTSLEVMYEVVKHLILFEERQLRHIREKAEDIGRELFKNKEKEILETINYLKRDVSEYRIVVRLQEPILKSLAAKSQKFWGGDAELYLSDLLGEQSKIVSQLEDCRDAIADFEETNTGLMNLKINNVMKMLASLSFVAFPAILLAEIFTMNTRDMPIVGLPHAFAIVVGAMAIMVLVTFFYFKKKDWL